MSVSCRYLQVQSIQLSKKKAIQEWKSELLHEKNKNHEQALITEILDEKESINDINIDNHAELDPLGEGDEEQQQHNKEAILSERQAAKARIIKWKADRLKQLETERVSVQCIQSGLFFDLFVGVVDGKDEEAHSREGSS